MPSNYTENYNLNQWSKSDRVLMEDFNADNAKIDAALEEKADKTTVEALGVSRIIFGTYTGDGTSSRVIELGLKPKAVLVVPIDGRMYSQYSPGTTYGGLALEGNPVVKDSKYTAIELTDTGFTVYHRTYDGDTVVGSNYNNKKFRYLAFI